MIKGLQQVVLIAGESWVTELCFDEYKGQTNQTMERMGSLYCDRSCTHFNTSQLSH